MTTDRYKVSAVPVGGGERVTGYYACIAGEVHVVFTGQINLMTVLVGGEITWVKSEVDPGTIEFVKAPVKRERTIVGDYRCPNCNAAFIEGAGTTPYCGNCGQALDWDAVKD